MNSITKVQCLVLFTLYLFNLPAQIKLREDSLAFYASRGPRTYFVDGFTVFNGIGKTGQDSLLKEMTRKLKGCWKYKGDSYSLQYVLSDTSFAGYIFSGRVILARPLVRLAFINGMVKIIHSDVFNIRKDTGNIAFRGDTLWIDEYMYKRVAK